ncbi:FMN-dependent NADH-azoreductase [Microbacterium hatanonis]|jgi:FMN-dependent NADH-azoreductase|uniref:Flavodoxin family protein n=1 Tax=Microbacterium hatanonis TaxID=404366 RepID=A0A5C8HWV3_9MICO|nr:NAD(P)H-dependent oxidoreductase [Microbacterium hatanonis]TXK09416.1 flavodoxin family protein [Microbacterium hatanonis]
MVLFRLDASIREEGSLSRELGDVVEAEWAASHPGASIVRRHVGVDPVPASAWAAAVSAGAVEPGERSAEQRDAVALAATFVDELVEADAFLFAVPLYNFGVSQHFKSWVDLVVTDERMQPGATTLRGRPAVLATVQGGNYRDGTPREGWDHATGWMRRILADVWGMDVRVVQREFTLVGVNPALDQFADAAAEIARESHAQALEHGRFLADALSRAAA